MTYIQWFESDEGIPVPVIAGEIQVELALFMYLRATEPSKRGGRREKQTLDNIKWQIKIWFDHLQDLKDDQGKQVTFATATYKGHLEPLREALLNDPDDPIMAESYNQYYITWRQFYDFCNANSIPTLMKFPAVVETPTGQGNQPRKDDDMLAHTRSGAVPQNKDPGLAVGMKQNDYAHRFINLTLFSKLASALGDVDPVYEAIAHAMLQTGLRIAGVLQWPAGPCAQNRQWLRYAEMKQNGIAHQSLRYWPKGKKQLKQCLVMYETMEFIQNIYITPHYLARCNLYEEKHGTTPPSSCLWLNQNGKPVERWDVWDAFKEASNKIGMKVTPHFLRHTYATYVIWNYFKANNLPVNLTAARGVHYAVKDQLGHNSIESTERYIRTILRVQATAWLPELAPSLREKVHENLPLKVQNTLAKYFHVSGEA